jgi:hypothetical protein
MILRHMRSVIALVLLLTTSACEQHTHPDLQLWVPANATVYVQPQSSKEGTAHVGFTVVQAREELAMALTKHFEQEGWHRRDNQYLNPGVATSFTTGWDYQGQWTGEWEDTHGDVITYHLLSNQGPQRVISNQGPVRAYGEFVTPAVVKHAQDVRLQFDRKRR